MINAKYVGKLAFHIIKTNLLKNQQININKWTIQYFYFIKVSKNTTKGISICNIYSTKILIGDVFTREKMGGYLWLQETCDGTSLGFLFEAH